MIDFKKELFAHAYKQRIPLTATIELTSQCNFRCVHCYIEHACRTDMLCYEDVVAFGEQIISMGCLYVTLTGGEVLLHPDFKRIYQYFVRKGVCVSVFTNGSRITPDIVEFFSAYPPRVVEITMYGFSEETYKAVTKTASFEQTKQNVLSLKERGIPVFLKMFVVKENYDDFPSIHQFAKEHAIPFKYDFMIIGTHPDILKHQIPDEQAMELERRKESIEPSESYNELMYQQIMEAPHPKLYLCGAGRSSCWLKSSYRLRMCNFIDCIEFELRGNTVSEAWEYFRTYTESTISQESACAGCQYRSDCDYCPAKSYATYQTTDMRSHPEISCKLARIHPDIGTDTK